jgi:hypothetical protein
MTSPRLYTAATLESSPANGLAAEKTARPSPVNDILAVIGFRPRIKRGLCLVPET